jgi:hypothetical protein
MDMNYFDVADGSPVGLLQRTHLGTTMPLAGALDDVLCGHEERIVSYDKAVR